LSRHSINRGASRESRATRLSSASFFSSFLVTTFLQLLANIDIRPRTRSLQPRGICHGRDGRAAARAAACARTHARTHARMRALAGPSRCIRERSGRAEETGSKVEAINPPACARDYFVRRRTIKVDASCTLESRRTRGHARFIPRRGEEERLCLKITIENWHNWGCRAVLKSYLSYVSRSR